MFQSQQQQQQSSFTYFPQGSNSIPNPLLSFPQPPTLPSQPLLFPPGTDPYAHAGQLTLTHVEFEAHAQFYEDPNVGFQSWMTRQADPITYDATTSGVALNSSSSNDWTNQSSVNNVIGNTQNQSKLRCEVCNIECSTKYVYEEHIMGKKHKRNLQVKINPTPAIFPETSNTINNVSIVANGQELERKKQKLLNAGAGADSVRMCTICNVVCNSHEAFTKHLSGRRHAAQAGLIAVDGVGPYLAALRANDHFWNKGKKKIKIDQSSWCEVCKINCNSNDAYAKHVSGKKHLKNLEDLEKSKNGPHDPSTVTPAATNLIIRPVENPAANSNNGINVQKSEQWAAESEATKEDLEKKKRKVMEGGAAAAAVRVCKICNVVCNSQKVFKYHLTGQKHAAMVKKQTEA